MKKEYKKYLNPSLISKIENLSLRAKLVVEGFIIGMHKSPYHGFSVEFSEHRPYGFGDEIKYIDWKLWGKTDRFYIKQFEEETNLKCHIILDKSSSMNFGSKNITKFEYSKLISAAMSYLMIKQQDAVRKLFSYVLLVSILSPTGVEVLHAIHDSHEIITEQNTSINENKFDCQINLLSFQDDDFNFSSNI